MNKVIAVIPSRYASTRFPGKPLALLNGVEMIAWVVRAALKAKKIDHVLVATDDEKIAAVARRESALVAMTDSALPSGTDRIWSAVKDLDFDLILNVQGDEPLIKPELIDQLVTPFESEADLQMATLAHPISAAELLSNHSVKVIVNKLGNAIYFSRFAIPYSRDNAKQDSFPEVFKHIGLYAYRKSFLGEFCAAPQAEIEIHESLEQLRALYLGAKIKVIQTEEKSWGVDNPEDLKKVESMMGKS